MNRLINITFAAILVALTGIGAHAAYTAPEKPTAVAVVKPVRVAFGPDWQASARRYVRNELKDPESAIFGDVRTYARAVCGTVNARNSYGGYAGGEMFIVYDRDRVAFAGRTKNFKEQVRKLCR